MKPALTVTALLAACSFAAGAAPLPPDAPVSLTMKPTGAMKDIGYYAPLRLELTADKPATLKKSPEGLSAPLYGVLKFGPAPEAGAAPARIYHVIVDEPEGKEARLFVDTNGNGDLTDDKPAEWKGKPYKDADGKDLFQYGGGADLETTIAGKPVALHLGTYRFDKNDPNRAGLKAFLFYYRDYALEGEVTLGGKAYKALLSDENATGDFRGTPDNEGSGSGIKLLLDANGNGKFDSRGESFDIRAPFNIAGVTYEIKDMTPAGDTFKVVLSDKKVDAVPTPPDHAVGKKITAFEAKTMDGKDLKFPGDYKGKIVLLDFWATWCGPCMMEVPGLVKAYEQFHPRGFEVLGITFDNANAEDKVKGVTKDKGMTWTQVYEGKGWKTKIGDMYAIDSIPRAFLVDGDTGEILATGEDLRGERLEATIKRVLDRNK